jgi:hypothetical protein
MKPATKLSKKIQKILILLSMIFFVVMFTYVVIQLRNYKKPQEKIELPEPRVVEIRAVISDIDEDPLEQVMEVPEDVEEQTIRYFDVPLSENLQNHIFTLCEEHNLDPSLVIAMIWKESNYIDSAIGDNGNSLGLMQIQPRWNQSRMSRLNCPDLMDPYQNVTVGIDILAELFASDKPVEWVLMSYNGGSAYANSKWTNGEVSSYAKTVLSNIYILEAGCYGSKEIQR